MIDRIAIACALIIVICTLAMIYLWLAHKPLSEEAAARKLDELLSDLANEPPPPRIHNAAIEATAEAVQEYVVSGRAKKIPFRHRRKELREAGRTQRRKMEEWRDDE